MAFKNAPVTKSTLLTRVGTSNRGAGVSNNLAAGYNASGTERHRFALKAFFAYDFFDDMREVLHVWLYMFVRDWYHCEAATGDPQSDIRRAKASWKEGTATTESTGNALVFPGPPTETTNDGAATGRTWKRDDDAASPYAIGKWVRVDVTDLAVWWAPVTVPGPKGFHASQKDNEGVVVASSFDDWTAAPTYTSKQRNAEFASEDYNKGAYAPYFRWKYSDNAPPAPPPSPPPAPPPPPDPVPPPPPEPPPPVEVAPLPPPVFSPTTAADGSPYVVNTPTGLYLPTYHEFSDPDLTGRAAGPTTDYLSASDFQLFDSAATDATANSGASVPIGGTTHVPVSGTASTTLAYNLSIPIALRNASLQWRVRDYDRRGVAGAWTPLQKVRPNARPTLAAGQVTIDANSLNPNVSVVIADADPGASLQAANGVRVLIERVNRDGTVTVMTPANDWHDSGGGTAATVSASTSLAYADTYRLFVQIADQWGGVSPAPTESGAMTYIYFTPQPITGVSNVRPKTIATKHTSRRPTITIGNSVQWDQYRIIWYPGVADDGITPTGTPLYDSGIVAAAPTLVSGSWDLDVQYPAPGTASVKDLSWGQLAYFTVAVRLYPSGVWSAEAVSAAYAAQINALPVAPIWWMRRLDGQYLLLSSAFLATSETLTPVVRMPYSDVDATERGYGDTPNYRSVEVRKTSDNSLVARVVNRLYAPEDEFMLNRLLPFECSNASLTPAQSGWTPGAAHALTYEGTIKTQGDRGLKIVVTAQPASTVVDLGPSAALSSEYTDLSAVATFKVDRQVDGTITNLTALRLRAHFSGNDANYAEFNLATSVTGTGAMGTVTLTKAAPTATGGAVNWAQVHRWSLVVVASGSLTFTAYVDNLVVDPMLLNQTTYKATGRYIDNNTELVWGPSSAALVKASTGVIPDPVTPPDPDTGAPPPDPITGEPPPDPSAWGAAPATDDPTPTLTYTYSGSADQATRQLRIYRRRGLYDLLAQRPGLIGFWPLDEAAGTNADDKSANALDGTYTGTVTLAQAGTTGDSRTAVLFDASGEKVVVADNALLEPTSITLVALVRIQTLADLAYLFRKLDGSLGSYFLRIGGSGAGNRQIQWYIETSAGVHTLLGQYPEATVDPALNTWFLLVATFDLATLTGALWVNGVRYDAAGVAQSSEDAKTAAPAGIFYSASGNLEIGVVGGAASVRQQMTAILGRATDDAEAAAFYTEVLRGPQNELAYTGPVVADVQAPAAVVTLEVPVDVLLDDAVYWASITVVDADGLRAVLA